MAFDFKFPDVAEGLLEGKLVDWKVKEGDVIKPDQVLCEMETDKSVLEIPSPTAGVVRKLHFKAGDVVKVGQVLITLDTDGSSAPKQAASPTPASSKSSIAAAEISQNSVQANSAVANAHAKMLPKDRRLAKKVGVDIATLAGAKGSGQEGRITDEDIKSMQGTGKISVPVSQSPASAQALSSPLARTSSSFSSRDAAGRIRAAPSVRKLARELGVDIERIVSSSPDGRIGEDDVQRAAHGEEILVAPKHSPAPTIIETSEEKSRSDKASPANVEGDSRQKIEGVRAVIKKRMEAAWKNIPHAAVAVEVDIGNLIEERDKEKKLLETKGIKLTYLAFIIKVTAAALEKFPIFNSTIDEASQEIVFRKRINVGFATDTEHGLVVPNIKDCNHKSISGIAREIQTLAEKARQKKLTPDDITGGTLSITNIGSFGGVGGVCIINYPEVAILMVSHVQDRIDIVDGKPVVRKMLPLTLTFDHRIIDGADAGRFLQYVAEHLSNPSYMLLDVI